ncbi:hypothetical protein IEN92_05055 [Polynucleobacter sp. MWH-Creno-3A4]|uniref:hypothetical protein n=1 Tax=Polynucleobacter sp. MWH-Creno-3A4 TaxID=1855886 RepID=UPI001C0E6A2D|nr:hypothetical protein [Polynucleobacter sp. MWH-Creno-3A4]MBU3606117.1 hypothetical protein [Polynucleobacter sp. MWH-Creno-3A4]
MSIGKYLASVFSLALALGLIACGGFPTTHPDATKNTPANNKADLKDCAQSYPETPDGVYLKNRIDCMKLKGWQ